MIEAIAASGSQSCREKCRNILAGNTTIENELKHAGSFLTFVLKGDWFNAFDWAIGENKIALEGLKNPK